MMQWLAVLLLITAMSAGAGVLSSLHLLSTIQRIADSQKEVQERPVASAFSPSCPASQDLAGRDQSGFAARSLDPHGGIGRHRSVE